MYGCIGTTFDAAATTWQAGQNGMAGMNMNMVLQISGGGRPIVICGAYQQGETVRCHPGWGNDGRLAERYSSGGSVGGGCH